MTRIFHGDKWTKIYGSIIPEGEVVSVIRFFPRRKVLVEYQGRKILTMLWELNK